MKTLTLAAVAALLPMAALAHDGMHINDAYVRSTNPKTGAVFLTLENHRQVACTLQSVTSDAAERAELHTHAEEDGVMRMGPIEGGITVDAGEAHQLARGGDHVMLLGLTRPLADGDSIELSFDFGDCGTETATATVDNQREDTGATGHGDHSGH
ncbi:MAG: copper chaperone PCu(A)C [Paracoccus sp. (in: a-proteobacteria)]|uniref:copper chaperone PCu(A)C n=1 Tax=Paracoccus sp. TaxID=267 RepID=UPI002E8AEAAA|nr:copper chaperone PCu(A)C [Pseudomonadota bacterium]